jgi:RNA-directed DNA polymerase
MIPSFKMVSPCLFFLILFNMPESKLHKLHNKDYWIEVYQFFETRSFRQKEKLEIYKNIIDLNLHTKIANDVLAGNYLFKTPKKLVVNKLQTGKKKTVYLFEYQDDFLLKVINRILTEEFAFLISPACHSFQKQKGAKTAFRYLVSDIEIDKKYCLKTDIHNFFNSIQVDDFIENLPVEIKSDTLLFNLIKQILCNHKAFLTDGQIISEQKGLMAGCPLSPFLSNIYLHELDDLFTSKKITYTRYSDDIVIFDEISSINEHKIAIETYLANKKLQLNHSKTMVSEPGELSVFLGFSYKLGQIDLSTISVEKMKGKVKRLSRSYLRWIRKKKIDEIESLAHFIARLNRKLYGIDARENDLCWAHWFFPVINTSKSLEYLDNYIQQRLRYSITGKFSKLNYKKVPYKKLSDCGYIPLKSAFFAFKKDYNVYLKLINSDIYM